MKMFSIITRIGLNTETEKVTRILFAACIADVEKDIIKRYGNYPYFNMNPSVEGLTSCTFSFGGSNKYIRTNNRLEVREI